MSQHTHINSNYRPDIDGLRAIAVLAVIYFHTVPEWGHIGFIGVDVFFVISGYLISKGILQELEQGRFSLFKFYLRRVLRIFPALVFLMAFCLVAGWFLLLPDELSQLGKHLAGGATFLSNFILLGESGYFDNAADTKPLLHLWSLGIEEQFYILFPITLWLAYKFRFSSSAILLILGSSSYLLNIYLTKKEPTLAFYSPVARFWELLIGALIAQISLHMQSRNQRSVPWVATLASIFGFFLLWYGLIRIDSSRPFPGSWALLPCASTAILILTPTGWINRRVLSLSWLRWIGSISYPLYLWHWVLLVFPRILASEPPPLVVRFACIGVSVIAAILSNRVIEAPLRFGNHPRRYATILAICMVSLGSIGYFVYVRGGLPGRPHFQSQLKQLTDLEKIDNPRAVTWLCNIPPFNLGYCSLSRDDAPTDVLIGDSHAYRLFPGLKTIFEPTPDRTLLLLGGAGCPPFIDLISYDHAKSRDIRECEKKIGAVLRRILQEDSVRQILLTHREGLYLGSESWVLKSSEAPETVTGDNAYLQSMDKTFELLTKSGKQITLVRDVPELSFDIRNCVDRPLKYWFVERTACQIDRGAAVKKSLRLNLAISSILKKYPTVKVIDLSSPFCDETSCVAKKDGRLLYMDDNHLSIFGATYVSDKLKRAFWGH